MDKRRPRRFPAGLPRAALAAWVVAMALAGVHEAAAQEPGRSARAWAEVGPSYDRSELVDTRRGGYAVAVGGELGRVVSLTLGVGFEHYPFAGAPYFIDYRDAPLNVLRVDGEGSKALLCETFGLRVAMPGRHVQPFVEAGLGVVTVWHPRPRVENVTTGTVVNHAYYSRLSAVAGELGAGIRSRRAKGYNWSAGIRWRGYSQIMEGESGSAIQLRVGIVTR